MPEPGLWSKNLTEYKHKLKKKKKKKCCDTSQNPVHMKLSADTVLNTNPSQQSRGLWTVSLTRCGRLEEKLEV